VLTLGSAGIFHGQRTLVLSDDDGQIFPAHSISAGLDYPGVGPEHAWLRDRGRAEYVAVTDEEALDAFQWLARTEGILPALESAHAVAQLRKLGPSLGRSAIVIVSLSGRGDKDAPQVRDILRGRREPADA
jgi:tryptophan synthase beta chain